MDKQQEYVLRAIEERDVRFIRLVTDVLGVLKSVAIAPAELEGAFAEGIGFDGSSIEGLSRVYESDMLAKPDPSTFQVLPWRGDENGVARMFCDVLTPPATRPSDPRGVLKRAMNKAADAGFTFYTHPEIEFYLFQNVSSPKDPLVPIDTGGYFDHVARGTAHRQQGLRRRLHRSGHRDPHHPRGGRGLPPRAFVARHHGLAGGLRGRRVHAGQGPGRLHRPADLRHAALLRHRPAARGAAERRDRALHLALRPRRAAQGLGYLVDLLAAIPSVVYGMWGMSWLVPQLEPLFDWLSGTLGFIPLFADFQAPAKNVMSAGIVLAVMILPIITATIREVFLQTPRLHEERAATRPGAPGTTLAPFPATTTATTATATPPASPSAEVTLSCLRAATSVAAGGVLGPAPARHGRSRSRARRRP
ncbi:glutamine synthetase beta-grasp domain-containing protein [Georgenia sp. SUBG003]|uniref:glutamine synthetase beta-grasp domain-containing protein n=1 Tax=Georgenia sp. SUBG003 TaxID=1497974 RepID=UPI003AB13107